MIGITWKSQTMSKEEKYQELVCDVRQFYQSLPEPEQNIYLRWCNDCQKHINLWSYWQSSLDARIMVVGQDWGCPEESTVLENIRAINEGTEREYHVDPDSITDRNLCTLLNSIGFPAEENNPDLFFTNLALGYRNRGLTGGFRQSWIRKCEPFFRRLVDIVEPRVIICLGRNVFVGVTRAMEKKVRIGRYNEFIESAENPVEADGRMIFAEAHCGYFGTINRARDREENGMELQIEDWKRIKRVL